MFSSLQLPVCSLPKALLQNSSSSVNGGHSVTSHVENIFQILQSCFRTTAGFVSFSSFLVTCCLTVIPLCVLVVYISVQRWWQSSGITASHSDHFAYHAVINTFIGFAGMTLSGGGALAGLNLTVYLGFFIFCASMFVFMFFDTLTCVERYVAVVHPITYRNLKNVKGVTIRNVAIGCAWLLSFSLANFMIVKSKILIVQVFIFVTALCIAVVFFCSLCVLSVLIRPGPGKVGWAKQRVDQSKLRAFYTIVSVLVALLLRFGTNTFLSGFYTSAVPADDAKCPLIFSVVLMALPGSMVQPLLFLQRAGWLVCCKSKN